jgi:hypothetical protein
MRVLRHSIAWIVLASLFSAQGVVWAAAAHHSAQGVDAACASIDGPQFIGTRHQPGAQFETTDPPPPIEHCAICHQQRAMRSAHPGRPVAVAAASYRVAAPIDPALTLSLVVVPRIAPRGPPSLLESL